MSTPVAAAGPPSMIAPINDFTVDAGSTIVGATNLADHFAGAPEPVAYRATASTADFQSEGQEPFVRIRDGWVDIVAPSTSWTGSRRFTVEACTSDAGLSSCASSNTFSVLVVLPLFGRADLNPTGFDIAGLESPSALDPGAGLDLHLTSPPGTQLQSAPTWFVDGQPAGEGEHVQLASPSPGPHQVEARFETESGPVVVMREITVGRVASPAPWASAATFAFALGFGLLGVSILLERSARLRAPLVVFVIGSLYARLRRDSLLDHFNRGALHQVIKENPGIHFSEVRRRTGISHGSAVHHLRALEKGGYIRSVATGAFTRYYSSGQPTDASAYGLSPADTTVFAVVVEQPGIALGDLAQRVGRSLGATSRAVSRLSNLGYVTTERAHRKRLVYPRPGSPDSGRPGDAIRGEVKG